MIKIIANYLPQFHETPENNFWWGRGYTDWDAVKRAKPLYNQHIQPKVPLDNNYYNLTNIQDLKWQAKLAKNNNIYGFGIYHYWFSSNKKLLYRPAEIILSNSDIDINYMFIWDNASWKRTWSNVKEVANDWAPNFDQPYSKSNSDNGILEKLDYGNETDWKKHFEYLLPFFKDSRYIKDEFGRPIFMFFNMNNGTETLIKMIKVWDNLAKESGFQGICTFGKINNQHINICDYQVDYEPGQDGWAYLNIMHKVLASIQYKCEEKLKKPHFISYDKTWKRIIKNAKESKDMKHLYSGFVNYDDTPRRGIRGRIIKGATPEKFENYFRTLLQICKKQNKEYVFITAWNEWGEGAYLEPDKDNGKDYLKALSRAAQDII